MPCPLTTVTTSDTTILSPNYPGSYSHNKSCLYRAVAPEGLLVALQFTEFSIEYHPGCIYDRLTVYDGSFQSDPVLMTTCGTGIPNTIYSTSNKMLAVFETDDSVTNAGFRGVFTFVENAGSPGGMKTQFLHVWGIPGLNL
ncbi:Tolloid-like protein 1 [Holothuria leucospilota]|uniref:Tolloid-like protein 1 n=1 Tax=Holothuria leucospilota TaxID=206669 RepID=A0A9Q1HFD7_HOLLE|nr:Tolloid-like protein 1 [Holothuria leucospilota]